METPKRSILRKLGVSQWLRMKRENQYWQHCTISISWYWPILTTGDGWERGHNIVAIALLHHTFHPPWVSHYSLFLILLKNFVKLYHINDQTATHVSPTLDVSTFLFYLQLLWGKKLSKQTKEYSYDKTFKSGFCDRFDGYILTKLSKLLIKFQNLTKRSSYGPWVMGQQAQLILEIVAKNYSW